MSQILLARRKRNALVLDIISIFWIISAFFILGNVSTYVDIDLVIAVKGVVGYSLMIGALVLTWFTIGVDVDRHVSLSEIVRGIFLVFASVMIVALINSITWEHLATLSPELSPIDRTQFTMLMGTVEEVMFRGFLLNFLLALTDNPLLSNGIQAGVGATFHSAVYGMDQGLMVFVAVSFFFLGFIYMMSRGDEDPRPRLWPNITAHGLVNFLASLGGV